jgi:hypothetical protein
MTLEHRDRFSLIFWNHHFKSKENWVILKCYWLVIIFYSIMYHWHIYYCSRTFSKFRSCRAEWSWEKMCKSSKWGEEKSNLFEQWRVNEKEIWDVSVRCECGREKFSFTTLTAADQSAQSCPVRPADHFHLILSHGLRSGMFRIWVFWKSRTAELTATASILKRK